MPFLLFLLITSAICISHDHGYFKHRRNDSSCDPWDCQLLQSEKISIDFAPSVKILSSKESMISKEYKT